MQRAPPVGGRDIIEQKPEQTAAQPGEVQHVPHELGAAFSVLGIQSQRPIAFSIANDIAAVIAPPIAISERRTDLLEKPVRPDRIGMKPDSLAIFADDNPMCAAAFLVEGEIYRDRLSRCCSPTSAVSI